MEYIDFMLLKAIVIIFAAFLYGLFGGLRGK